MDVGRLYYGDWSADPSEDLYMDSSRTAPLPNKIFEASNGNLYVYDATEGGLI
jgi:hypothetical protein